MGRSRIENKDIFTSLLSRFDSIRSNKAPELETGNYTSKVDSFGIGAITYELITGEAFSSNYPLEDFDDLMISKELVDFVNIATEFESEKRASLHELY